MHKLKGDVGHPGAVGVGLDKGDGGGQNAVRLTAVAAHRDDRDFGQLPSIQLPDLGCGDLEVLAQPAEQSAHNLALEFQ